MAPLVNYKVLDSKILLNHCAESFYMPTLHLLKDLPQENSNQEPIIQFVDHMIEHAIEHSASDVHIEPYQSICRIRYRQDGILNIIAEIPIALAARLITRLKVMAKLDISERRLSQDGRFHAGIDIRMSTCATQFGEKVVLRLLDANNLSLDIDTLGLTAIQKSLFLNKLNQPQGLILVTGPTGSGKTVTLYSALKQLNKPDKNISTVEDPIEIQLNGINQVNINPKIGLDFATIFRTLLRQDPDILMLGEIRDPETANVAIQAAQTGHLVLSSLHTNCAAETLTRLQTMGIAAYNIICSLSLIIAQRLVRKLCPHCKQVETIQIPKLKFPHYRAVGCKHCRQGYLGRTAIYELLTLNDSLITLLLQPNTTVADIIAEAEHNEFKPLYAVGLELIKQGVTSLTELNRVILR